MMPDFPSILISALPFIFLSPEGHVYTPTALKAANRPPTLQLTKYFLKSDITRIREEFEEVKALGSSAAEGWLEGLEMEGKDKMTESSRWEGWASKGRLKEASLHYDTPPVESAPGNRIPLQRQIAETVQRGGLEASNTQIQSTANGPSQTFMDWVTASTLPRATTMQSGGGKPYFSN
jgi:hypothetical protein